MKNDFRVLLVGWGEPIYVKLKEVEKLATRYFKGGIKDVQQDGSDPPA